MLKGTAFGLAVVPLCLGDPRVRTAATSFGESARPSVDTVGLVSVQAPPPQPEHEKSRLWSPVAEETLAAPKRTWRIESRNYRTLRLDPDMLTDLLARAPRQRPGEVNKSEFALELPWPDGSFKSFRIEEVSISEPGLEARCPGVQAYTGQTHDRSAWVRFDWSSSGLHAQMSSGQDVVYIQPYSPEDTRHYVVYNGRDWSPGPERTEAAPAAEQAAPGSTPAESVSAARPTASSIEEISIAWGSLGSGRKLTFRRDGTANLMMGGVLGVAHTCSGSLASEDFAELAAFIQQEGFFELNESYLDPRIVSDGGSVLTNVIAEGRRRTVSHVAEAGPSNLKAIEHAIRALGRKVTWTEARR